MLHSNKLKSKDNNEEWKRRKCHVLKDTILENFENLTKLVNG